MGKFVELLTHPGELRSVIQLKYFREETHPLAKDLRGPDLVRCYELLNLTSRSFASVIQELNPELRDAIMIFYLVLRALDTVEDDMTLDPKIKIPLLREFSEKLKLSSWSFDGSGPNEKDRDVLVEFDVILREFKKLKPMYQDIIVDMSKQMGNGMADYILDENFNVNGVDTVKDYDLYCWYVAGLVGKGLTLLMGEAEFCDPLVLQDEFAMSTSMGLFLQKTNIIRDYHEDLEDGRSFWPKEIWSNHTDRLYAFHEDPKQEESGLACINELVLNSMGHIKDVLTYLSLVKDPSCFNFCAIPQVMAIATLALVYNNPDVLHKNVKIRKGTTCSLILNSRTLPDVVKIFRHYIQVINHKSNVNDPNYLKIGIKCGEIEQFIELMYPSDTEHQKQPKPINKYVEAREDLDKQVGALVTEETLRCNTALVGVGIVFFGIALYLI